MRGFNKGFLLSKIGKYKEALKCFDTILEISPEDISAKNAKEHINSIIKNNDINNIEKLNELTNHNFEEDAKLNLTPFYDNMINKKTIKNKELLEIYNTIESSYNDCLKKYFFS